MDRNEYTAEEIRRKFQQAYDAILKHEQKLRDEAQDDETIKGAILGLGAARTYMILTGMVKES
jgi:hypothetical protein